MLWEALRIGYERTVYVIGALATVGSENVIIKLKEL